TFGERGELHESREIERARGLLGGVQLRKPSVNDDEVGTAELTAPLVFLPVRETTAHHLFHGAYVVVTEYLFHVEVAIVALYGQRVFEDHHGSHVVGAL